MNDTITLIEFNSMISMSNVGQDLLDGLSELGTVQRGVLTQSIQWPGDNGVQVISQQPVYRVIRHKEGA